MSKELPQIQVTKDYNIFKTLSSNRQVNQNHVKQLQKSLQENPHLFETRPILVNENMFVIDGQHRLQAAKANNSPVYYVVGEGITVEDTRSLNTTQNNWAPIDFARSYASTGNKNYKEFLSAVAKFPGIPQSVVRSYLGNGNTHSEVETFKNGLFVVTRPILSNLYLEQLDTIKNSLPGLVLSRSYGQAFYTLFEKPDVFDYDYFVSKLAQEGTHVLMRRSATLKDTIRCIEDVYNYNRPEKNHVRFY